MSAFKAHLYKEYRDHRVGLWGLLALVVVAAVAARVALESYVFEGLVFLDYFTFGTMVAAAVLFAPDLVRSDEARGTLGFLLRMPRGVHRAFWSKVVFLLAVLVAFGLFAWLLGIAMRGGLDPELWLSRASGFDPTSWQAISLVVSCAFWMMAVACWLPRTTLCVPATAMLVGFLLLPAFLMLQQSDLGLLRYFPSLDPWHVAHPFVALLAAWMSFVRGRRMGRGAASSAWRGACVAVVGCAMLSGWVGDWVDELSTVKPEQLQIQNGLLGSGGRYVYLNTKRTDATNRRDWPSLSLVVDLEEESWHQCGGPGEGFAPLDSLEGGRYWPSAYHPMVLHNDYGSSQVTYLDGRTAQVLKEAPRHLEYLDVLEQARAHYRETTPLRLGDGRRCWIFRKRLEAETSDGGFEELPWDDLYFPGWVVGRGLNVHNRHGNGHVYDLTRQRVVELVSGYFWRWVLPEGLLRGKPIGSNAIAWNLLDLDSGEERAVPGLRDNEQVHAMLDDGRLLVTRMERLHRSHGSPWAVDVRTGQRSEMSVDYPWPEDSTFTMSGLRAPLNTQDGRRLLSFREDPWSMRGSRQDYTSHRGGTDELSPPVRAYSLVGCEESGTILVISADQSELHRVDLDTGEREILFPKP